MAFDNIYPFVRKSFTESEKGYFINMIKLHTQTNAHTSSQNSASFVMAGSNKFP